MVKEPDGPASEVEIDAHPENNLSAEALSVLTSLILVPSSDLALRRLDALQLLLNEWDELESSSDYDDWARRLGAAPVVPQWADDGTLERSNESSGLPAIPGSTAAALTRAIIECAGEARIRAIEGLRDLLAEWTPYFDDEDKLLGHLLRSHKADPSVIPWDHDDLLRHHSQLHGRTD
ncbi:MAG: hypothetical protein ACRD03_07855 [Acidimicrobiales bacterium]